jgi:hypothetical protein
MLGTYKGHARDILGTCKGQLRDMIGIWDSLDTRVGRSKEMFAALLNDNENGPPEEDKRNVVNLAEQDFVNLQR